MARSGPRNPRDKTISIGYEQIQRALDIVAFQRNWYATVSNPGDSHIVLFERGRDVVIQCVAVLIDSRRVYTQVTGVDRDGNIIEEPPPPPPAWSEPLRYYRMSQTATDLWEAYRNLFLGLESLLHLICPKGAPEKEEEWLLRALETVGLTIDLGSFVPPGRREPAKYLVSYHYKGIRCRLFHGKGELPATHDGTLSPMATAAAYEQLIPLWKALASRYLGVRSFDNGVITYQGFRASMERYFSQDLKVFYTEDNTPPKPEDMAVNPLGLPSYPFKEINYLGETTPGEVSFCGRDRVASELSSRVIHRICSVVGDHPDSFYRIPDGICPDGVDVFECLMIHRLHNAGRPKTSFRSENLA